MATKVLFPLSCLIVYASCGQNSLTFVIDDTYSMNPVIQQVKSVSKSIMNTVLKEKSSQIEDIVLVTFNDPGPGLTLIYENSTELKIRTRDPQQLEDALDSIVVHDGGWCPEMSLSGIKKGLQESRPGSYLYVFTDASAKDYDLFEEVKTLCQEKQSQIVFVQTDDCSVYSYYENEMDQVYYKIAEACTGQVFRIEIGDIQQVLDFVNNTIKGDLSIILSQTYNLSESRRWWTNIKFKIDEQTEYAIVSASGYDVHFRISRPSHNDKLKVDKITSTRNMKAYKLTNLKPGTYKARIMGSSVVTVRVFGRTDFTFNHGFSTEERNSLEGTDIQPTTGIETYMIVSVQDKANVADVQEAQFWNMADQELRKLPLTHITGDIYRTTKFLPPQQDFKIVVVAISKNTKGPVTRIAKTPVTPIPSVLPLLDKSEILKKVIEGASIDLACSVAKGFPTPTVRWIYKGREKTVSGKNILRLENVQLSDAGQYKCVAQNEVGRDEYIVQLLVNASPSFQNPENSVLTKSEGEALTIDCKIAKGSPRPIITWEFKAIGSTSYKTLKHDGEMLVISSTQPMQAGYYLCTAKNTEGHTSRSTELIVNAKPVLEN